MKIYAFCTADKYEGGTYTVSLHTTKRGAFKAMNKQKNDIFQQDREHYLRWHKGSERKHWREMVEKGLSKRYEFEPFSSNELSMTEFFIKEMEVQEWHV